MSKRAFVLAATLAAGCTTAPPPSEDGVVSARQAADMVHAVIAADRHAYTAHVVNRLTVDHRITVVDPVHGDTARFSASETWRNEHASLPLPAQMLRLGAERVAEERAGVHYTLLSPWPINDQNRPKTEVERASLARIAETREPTYAPEALGDAYYLTAVYPDIAVVEACVRCHNEHPESPRKDFEVGDVMGGLVIRIPLHYD